MPSKRLALSTLGLLLVCLTCAYAADKPNELTPYIHAQKPYGKGQFTAMWLTVYDAALWTDAPKWSWDSPFAISLLYHMDIDSKDLSEKSVEEIEKISPLTDAQTESYTAQFDKLFPDVREGDEITAIYIPGKATYVYHNGTQTGSITDPDFAKRFMSIWLSERTSSPKLRRALLSLKKS
jgi:Chalcone isomerase-like